MLGMGGAVKIVSDMNVVVDIARVIGDSTKADKLEALRNEFSEYLLELQNQAQVTQDLINLATIKESENKVKQGELTERQRVLDENEVILNKQRNELTLLSDRVKIDRKELELDQNRFQKSKSDWISLQDRHTAEFNSEKQKIEMELSSREKEIKKRENDVLLREDKATLKENTLFKQSQLAQAFIQSVK